MVNVSRLKSRVACVANYFKKVKVFALFLICEKPRDISSIVVDVVLHSCLVARVLFWAAKFWGYDHKVVMGSELLPPTFEQKMEVYCCWCVCVQKFSLLLPIIRPFVHKSTMRTSSALRADFQSFYGGELGH